MAIWIALALDGLAFTLAVIGVTRGSPGWVKLAFAVAVANVCIMMIWGLA